jgi:hypothetical protein
MSSFFSYKRSTKFQGLDLAMARPEKGPKYLMIQTFNFFLSMITIFVLQFDPKHTTDMVAEQYRDIPYPPFT